MVSACQIVPVAQWIERQFPELEATGSNPVRHATALADRDPKIKCSGSPLDPRKE